MALQNPARLTAIEGRSAILFETAAVVQFAELAPYGDAAQEICSTVNKLFGNDSRISIRVLGGISFDAMATQSLPKPSSDAAQAELATQDDSILIVLEERKFADKLPNVVSALSTLSMAFIEAQSITASLFAK